MHFSTNNGTLFNADAKLFLSQMPPESVDCIVTDPPYRVISGGNKSANPPVGILKENDGKIFEHNDLDFSDWIGEAYRVLKDDSHCYVMTNFLNLRSFMDGMTAAGFHLHNLLVWEKNNVLPNRWYMKNIEYTIFARKGKAKAINNPSSKTSHQFDNLRNKLHPTEKPIDLMRFYIENSTDPGNVVLDPFAGSGSTLVAASQAGRRFIGCEIDPAYYLTACGRIWGI